jgi:diguanylate cyclase (GGDEF)-like protein
MTGTPLLSEKIARLRSAYLAKLPHSLDEARHSCRELAATGEDDQGIESLHRIFHNLKGTAASLGLREISGEGSAGAELVAQLRRLGSAGGQTRRAFILTAIRACIGRLDGLVGGALTSAPDVSLPDASAAAPRKDGSGPQRLVFYCDDDLDGGQLASQLSCFGYTVTTFTEADALKFAVLADPPDAVVISTDHADMAADLRSVITVPVLFVSERSDFQMRLKAVQVGGEAYFLKPVVAHEIVDVLDAVTDRREPEPFRILIVDDEPEMAGYHGLILERAGMMPRWLAQPANLLDELVQFQPDLVLMDMYMPVCSGRDLSRLIRQIPQFVSLPIIFLSSETDKSLQVSAMRVGADGFLTKPIPPEDLVTAVAVRAERTRVLRSLMMRDSLTGLLNHTTLLQFLDTSMASTQRHGGQVCFIILDLDHFKAVNDTHGHPAGDQVLVGLARLLKQRLRNSDMIGRYGGEEFAVVLTDISVGEAVRVMDEIRRDFAALSFMAGGTEFSSSFSGGVAGCPDMRTTEAIIQAADRALYAAKHAGRNRIMAAEAAVEVHL